MYSIDLLYQTLKYNKKTHFGEKLLWAYKNCPHTGKEKLMTSCHDKSVKCVKLNFDQNYFIGNENPLKITQ